MSSTEPVSKKRRVALARVAAFYEKELLPRARSLETGALMPLGPDPDIGSYFVQREMTSMDPSSFELPGEGRADGVRALMASLWPTMDRETHELGAGCAELAEALRDSEEQSDEVSPFVYAMY